MRKSPINVNSWEEEDVKRGRKLAAEGKKGHADALFDDAHDSYNWHGGNYGHEGMSMRGQVSKGSMALGRAGHVGSYTGNNMKLNPVAETASQERTDLLSDMPIDDRATPVANLNKGYGQQVGKPSAASRQKWGGNKGDESRSRRDY
jgi:hypothetical protein